MVRFSASEVNRLYQCMRTSQYAGQRLGQAFCNHFALHKSVPGRKLEQALYEKDGSAARAIIAARTDHEN